MTELIRVYGHPRSGNNLLMAHLALNFYPGLDLATPLGRIGHWKKRVRGKRNPYGKLAGHHHFYEYKEVLRPAIYIIRDGRAVAWSMFQTKAFLHPDWVNMTFSEFLHTPLDWTGSPGRSWAYPGTIAEHWREHLESWKGAPDVLMVRYEELVAYPEVVRKQIARAYDVKPAHGLKLVTEPVGWFPHKATVDDWQEYLTKEDRADFHRFVPVDHWGLRR